MSESIYASGIEANSFQSLVLNQAYLRAAHVIWFMDKLFFPTSTLVLNTSPEFITFETRGRAAGMSANFLRKGKPLDYNYFHEIDLSTDSLENINIDINLFPILAEIRSNEDYFTSKYPHLVSNAYVDLVEAQVELASIYAEQSAIHEFAYVVYLLRDLRNPRMWQRLVRDDFFLKDIKASTASDEQKKIAYENDHMERQALAWEHGFVNHYYPDSVVAIVQHESKDRINQLLISPSS